MGGKRAAPLPEDAHSAACMPYLGGTSLVSPKFVLVGGAEASLPRASRPLPSPEIEGPCSCSLGRLESSFDLLAAFEQAMGVVQSLNQHHRMLQASCDLHLPAGTGMSPWVASLSRLEQPWDVHWSSVSAVAILSQGLAPIPFVPALSVEYLFGAPKHEASLVGVHSLEQDQLQPCLLAFRGKAASNQPFWWCLCGCNSKGNL